MWFFPKRQRCITACQPTPDLGWQPRCPTNRSKHPLIAGADYVLDTCPSQVRFVSGLLDFEAIKTRIEACLVFKATVHKQGVR